MHVAQTNGVLRRPELIFGNLFEAISDGIAIVHAERFVYANSAFAELLGIPRAELLRAEALGSYVPEHTRAELKVSARVAQETEMPAEPMAVTWLPRVGQPITMETHILPVLFDERPAMLLFLRSSASRDSREFESGTHRSERAISPPSEQRTTDALSRLTMGQPALDTLCKALSMGDDIGAEMDTARTTSKPAPPNVEAATRRARILVIDDEPLLGQTLAYAFSGKHDLVVTTGGRQALELLARDSNFDLVLCDLTMPDVTGAMVYEAIERDYPALLPRFVFMTGGVFSERASAFMARYRGLQLEKPFNIDDVEQMLLKLG